MPKNKNENEESDVVLTLLGSILNWATVHDQCQIELDVDGKNRFFPLHKAKVVLAHMRIKMMLTDQNEKEFRKLLEKPLRIDISVATEGDLLAITARERILGYT